MSFIKRFLMKILLYALKILLNLVLFFTLSGLFDFVALCDLNIEDSKSEAKPRNYTLIGVLVFAGIAIASIIMLTYGITPEASIAPASPPPIQVFDPHPERSEGLILKAIREFLEWVDNRRGGR
jgi:hypothetical protein